jgi:hypothetical protein
MKIILKVLIALAGFADGPIYKMGDRLWLPSGKWGVVKRRSFNFKCAEWRYAIGDERSWCGEVVLCLAQASIVSQAAIIQGKPVELEVRNNVHDLEVFRRLKRL